MPCEKEFRYPHSWETLERSGLVVPREARVMLEERDRDLEDFISNWPCPEPAVGGGESLIAQVGTTMDGGHAGYDPITWSVNTATTNNVTFGYDAPWPDFYYASTGFPVEFQSGEFVITEDCVLRVTVTIVMGTFPGSCTRTNGHQVLGDTYSARNSAAQHNPGWGNEIEVHRNLNETQISTTALSHVAYGPLYAGNSIETYIETTSGTDGAYGGSIMLFLEAWPMVVPPLG